MSTAKMFLELLFCVISLNISVYGYTGTAIAVETPVGRISGLSTEEFMMFLGVPYGLVEETNPFGNANPHPHFQTAYEAFDDSTICPQYVKGQIKGTIQCLHLNIYKPNVSSPVQKLPVMVYIHGGKFVEGDGALSTYSPKFLMRHDVILVTVNYRLGPYGNLCLPNTKFSNQGLKDQILALNWVKNNIGSFGGDPDNILLFGHSSGAMSVHFHLLFDKDILFNKVILQSGVAIVTLLNDVTDTRTFVKDVGLDAENINVDNFIKTISTIDTETLINMTKHYDFRPCIDGEYITKTPKMRNLQNMKLMIGGTTKEMLYWYPRGDSSDSSDFATQLNKGFTISKMADSTDAINEIKHFYFNNSKLIFVDYASDLAYNYPIEKTVRYYVQSGSQMTVYRYLFSYDGGRNFMKIRDNITFAGTTHGDELGYLYDMPILKNTTQKDQVVIDRMCLLWTNFAKYGEPTPSTSNLLQVKWTPVTAETEPYLQIDEDVELHNAPFQNRMAFWDAFYAKYGMFAKGIHLEGKYAENRAFSVGLSKLLMLCLLFVLQ